MRARHRLQGKSKTNERQSRLRKLLVPLLLLFIVKISYLSVFVFDYAPFLASTFSPSDVAAQEDNASKKSKSAESVGETDNKTKPLPDSMLWNYDLIQALKKREKDLRIKEGQLKKEEERLLTLRQEIENKIDTVGGIAKRIEELIATKKALEDEKVRKLAKVFEATPPEQAGPLLSKLDVDIAAQLLIKMQGRKAGRIWGYVDPDKAVKISKELARLKPELDLSKMTGK